MDIDQVAEALIRNLKKAINAAGETENGLAKKTGMSCATLRHRLDGKSSFRVGELLTISKILGSDIRSLLPEPAGELKTPSCATAPCDEIRAILARRRIPRRELARRLHRSETYLAARMNGHKVFTASELSAVAEALNLPLSLLLDSCHSSGQNDVAVRDLITDDEETECK